MKIRRRLSYANVMSTIAAFGMLAGGSAYAANKMGPEDIQKDAVHTRHVDNGTLLTKDFKPGQLPETPTVENPTTVTNFGNGWSAYDAGTPDPADDAPVKYWKDPSGVVHLEGAVTHTAPVADNSVMFTLPSGYHPAANYPSFAVLTSGFYDFDEVLGFVQVTGESYGAYAGEVQFDGGNPEFVSLDGVTFRAE